MMPGMMGLGMRPPMLGMPMAPGMMSGMMMPGMMGGFNPNALPGRFGRDILGRDFAGPGGLGRSTGLGCIFVANQLRCRTFEGKTRSQSQAIPAYSICSRIDHLIRLYFAPCPKVYRLSLDRPKRVSTRADGRFLLLHRKVSAS